MIIDKDKYKRELILCPNFVLLISQSYASSNFVSLSAHTLGIIISDACHASDREGQSSLSIVEYRLRHASQKPEPNSKSS